MHGFLPIGGTIFLDATTEATGRTPATIYRATKKFRGRNLLHDRFFVFVKGALRVYTLRDNLRVNRKTVRFATRRL